MEIIILPKTRLGALSSLLLLSFFIFFSLGILSKSLYTGVPAGKSILADFSNRPFLTVSMILSFLSAVSAMIVGLVSIIKQKERSFLVYIAILAGFLITIFLLGETFASH